MQKRFQSIALIRKLQGERHFWLACWDVTKSQFEFVTAPRLEQESFRDAIRREVGWVFDLDPNRDFLVSNMAQLNLEFVACLPLDDSVSHIAVSFFLVDLYRPSTLKTVESNSDTRWLSSAEVCAGETVDKLPLDPQLVYLIQRAKVINAWQ